MVQNLEAGSKNCIAKKPIDIHVSIFIFFLDAKARGKKHIALKRTETKGSVGKAGRRALKGVRARE